jgi:hypothetical protein
MAIERVPVKDLKTVRWHGSLPKAAREQAGRLYDAVGKHVCDSREEWVDGFCNDLHYHRELAVWERIASAWVAFSTQYPEPAGVSAPKLVGTLALISTGDVAAVSRLPYARQLLDCYLKESM